MIFNRKKIPFLYFLAFLLTFSGEVTASDGGLRPSSLTMRLQIPNKLSGGENSRGKIMIERTTENAQMEYTFRLETNNPSLIKFRVPEVKIVVGQNAIDFDFRPEATAVKTNAIIKAVLQNQPTPAQVENSLEIFPAMIKSVTNTPSMAGTKGAQVEVVVELRAPAPAGGTSIHLSPFLVAGFNEDVAIPDPNLQIPAGSTRGTFLVRYNQLTSNGAYVARLNSRTTFNEQKRTLEFVVALEPQITSGGKLSYNWTPIPGIAVQTKIDVVPLLVTSISYQPAVISGGTEVVGNFTLNLPPGSGEIVYFSPRRFSDSKLWVRPLSSSCLLAGEELDEVEIPVTAGATNHSFRICTASVTSATTVTIQAAVRSTRFQKTATVQP